MKHDIIFYVSVFSKQGTLLETFPIRAPTKLDAENIAAAEAKKRYPDYDYYKIS